MPPTSQVSRSSEDSDEVRLDETFKGHEEADDKEHHVENKADNQQGPFKRTVEVSINRKFAEYTPAEDKGASDRRVG